MEVGPNLIVGDRGQMPERSEEPPKYSISSKRLNEVNIKHSFSPDDVVLASSANTVIGTEASGPPSPQEGAIPNFGAIDIEQGIYRSSFPHSCNIQHLNSLKLKTVVTLVSTTFESDLKEWLATSNVEHFRIIIPAHKSKEDSIPMENIAQVLSLMNDETKRPILIHCNKGKHRTGCMTACFRKLHGMDDVQAITEYHEYARPKARAYDIAFISRLKSKEVLRAIIDLRDAIEPVSHCHIQRGSKCFEKDSIRKREQAASIEREGSRTADDSEGSDLSLHRFSAKRQVTAPEPPMSPPFSAATDLGFSASELIDALSKLGDGRDRAALTPPQTPAEEYGSQ